MASPYEKEVIDILVGTKAKAVMFMVVEGTKGTSFECRCVDEKYLKMMPRVLLDIASRIEGDFAKKEMDAKHKELPAPVMRSNTLKRPKPLPKVRKNKNAL